MIDGRILYQNSRKKENRKKIIHWMDRYADSDKTVKDLMRYTKLSRETLRKHLKEIKNGGEL